MERKSKSRDRACEPATAYVGFGANVGDREEMIIQALVLLANSEHIKIGAVSSLYETEPVGYKHQAEFLNGVVEISTVTSPMELLNFLLIVEAKLGRTRRFRWGPRTIDLDILLFDGVVIDSEALTVPHPELANRRFVLEPLAELAPQARVPGSGKKVIELLKETSDTSNIRLYKKSADVEHRLEKV
jgi:2-amino-4-hydroxy-6-hydroxymethyldihydropteridine diphosphokinase